MKKDLMLDYEMEMAYITKRSADKLEIVNARKIRKTQVDSLTALLMSGENFDSCIVISRKTNYTQKVIDGQHRVLAMRNYFEKYPESRIQVAFAVYKRLNKEKERDVYRKWNISIKQSTDDFINSYKEAIPMYDRLTREIPCRVYGTASKMKLRDIINAYIAVNEKPYKGGFVKYLEDLKDEDVDNIVPIFNIIMSVFNPKKLKDFHKISAFKNIVFRAIYYLVANNVERLGADYLKRRMKSVLADRKILDDYRRFYGRRASVDAYLAFQKLLNDTKSEKQFV